VSADLLIAPFPYFGNKRHTSVRSAVWASLGDAPNYLEPFCGALGMLLGRPGGPGKIETVNDISGGLTNAWRAIQADPDAVAQWCDWPVNEIDMHARHQWLVEQLEELTPELREDPDLFDAKVAGWWIWGACIWIGGGWCGGVKRGSPRPNLNSGQGVHALSPGRRPMVTSAGMGVHATSPGKRPHVTNGGVGVNASRLPSIGNDRGVNGVASPPTRAWFRALSARLRGVRVLCGNWDRILSPSVMGKGRNVGGRRPAAVFLDPPYDPDVRAQYLYAHDDRRHEAREKSLSTLAREWALEHGDDPDIRIALCGYEGEHDMPENWRKFSWKGARGYAASDNNNRELERVWFSPHCLQLDQPQQASLFEVRDA
jgi:site-specific DNA-adenine methylase